MFSRSGFALRVVRQLSPPTLVGTFTLVTSHHVEHSTAWRLEKLHKQTMRGVLMSILSHGQVVT